MNNQEGTSPKRLLDSYTLISEVLFGLIMVLTFTGSLSIVDSGHTEVREMLIGALGCNIAWGVIDGIFYLMDCVSVQGQGIRALRALRKSTDATAARQAIAGSLPPLLAETLNDAEYASIHQRLLQRKEPPLRPRLSKADWLGALAVFFWVFITTFPVAIPFIFMEDLWTAMRVSNGIAIVSLFITGFAFAKVAEYRPWLTGIGMVLIGSVVVAGTIALGG